MRQFRFVPEIGDRFRIRADIKMKISSKYVQGFKVFEVALVGVGHDSKTLRRPWNGCVRYSVI